MKLAPQPAVLLYSGCNYLADVGDGSGLVQPSVSWSPLERATLTFGAKLPY